MRLTAPLRLGAAFLAFVPGTRADVFTVVNTSGQDFPGSFLAALTAAENNPGNDTIAFAIPGAGPHRIRPEQAITITDPLIVDGRSQPGYTFAPLVELDGTLVGGSALTFTADGCQVLGLAIYNFESGVLSVDADGTVVQGCYIGIDATGMHPLGNGTTPLQGAGVTISGGDTVLIGGFGANERNLICGNTCGVRLEESVRNTQVLNNRFGTDAQGDPLGFQSYGLMVHGSYDTLITGNTIAYNDQAGVWIRRPLNDGCCDAQRCTVLDNSIHCNGGLGIQVGNLPWSNDPGDGDIGPNGLQNSPVMTFAFTTQTSSQMGGTLDSAPNGTYTIEIYGSETCTGAESEAEDLLWTQQVTTDGTGHASFGIVFLDAPMTPGITVRASATDSAGNTSPLSENWIVIQQVDIAYVDPDAPGAADGSSWQDAFTSLQDALDAATSPGSPITELRLAEGNYTPVVETVPGDPRSATFTIPDGLALRGSYAGWGTPDPDVQDLVAHPARLTGDLLGNDFYACCPLSELSPSTDENVYHVVDLAGTGPGTTLECLRIHAGRAVGAPPHNDGAGLFMESSSATIRGCVMSLNWAAGEGGGAYVTAGTPTFEDCTFRDNRSGGAGGGLLLVPDSPVTIRNTIFRGNRSTAGYGGGLHTYSAQVTLEQCEFVGNHANQRGGGAYCGGFAHTVTALSCTFGLNHAGLDAAGIYAQDEIVARNTIFWGNTSASASGEAEELQALFGATDLDYCCVQGWSGAFGGVGNHGLDPLFTDTVGNDGSADSGDEDLTVAPGSACIDAGDNAAVPAGLTTDLTGGARFQDDPYTADTGAGAAPLVDQGAREFERVDLGVPFCFGDGSGTGCPCGNDSPTPGESCLHSGGTGMTIRGEGSRSISADDLVVVIEQVPPNNSGLIYSGTLALDPPNLIWDGLQCTLGDTRRYQALFQSSGVFTDTGFVSQDPSGTYFVPGVGYNFQLWTRDAANGPSPCGSGANYSPAYLVVMAP